MSAARDKRQEVRLNSEEHELIEKAASWKGLSVPDFLRSVALEMARATLNDKNFHELSTRDWEALNADLHNPPEPNAALIKLMKRGR